MSTERTMQASGASILEARVCPDQVILSTGLEAQNVNFELNWLLKCSQ